MTVCASADGEEHLGADAHKTFINERTHIYFDGKRWKGPGTFIARAFQNEIRAYARLCKESVPYRAGGDEGSEIRLC